MSVDVNIAIKIRSPVKNDVAIDVVNVLIDAGWTFLSPTGVYYLPVGDKDEFNWCYGQLNDEEINSIFKEKFLQNEIIGVELTWQKTDIGGEFLFYKNGLCSISLSKNRKKIDNSNVTDVSWYLEKICMYFLSQGLIVESIKYSEFT